MIHPAAHPRVEVAQPARLENLPVFIRAIDDFCARAGVDASLRGDLQLVVEEACVNVFNHAWSGRQAGELRMSVCLRQVPLQPAIVVTFRDRGKPFNPLEVAAPDTTGDAESRAIGGLGVHLIRQMSDEQSYTFDPERGNSLTVVKHLPPATGKT